MSCQILLFLQINTFYCLVACAGPESFVKGRGSSDKVFLVNEGRGYLNTSKSGPSSARQQNTI